MSNEGKIKEAIEKAKSILQDVTEPEKTLSFPIVLSFLLNEAPVIAKKLIPEKSSTGEDKSSETNFKGLTGGMRFLIQEGFFKEERSQNEILTELQRHGYRYPKTSLPPILINLIQKRILNRSKGSDDNWRYAERK